jgi:predicted RecB family endonuclease
MNTIGNSTIIITTREDIIDIVGDAVRTAITPLVQRPKDEPERFNINEAVEYLKKMGITISKSSLYKSTSNGGVPVHRFGNRLVFIREDLDDWACSMLKSTNNNKIAYAVANSITRKNKL